MLARLGLPDPGLIEALRADWNDLAGEPWAGQSHPAYLRGGELVVNVSTASLVSLLRYATGDLLRRLDDRLGEGMVSTVRVAVSSAPALPPRGGESDL